MNPAKSTWHALISRAHVSLFDHRGWGCCVAMGLRSSGCSKCSFCSAFHFHDGSRPITNSSTSISLSQQRQKVSKGSSTAAACQPTKIAVERSGQQSELDQSYTAYLSGVTHSTATVVQRHTGWRARKPSLASTASTPGTATTGQWTWEAYAKSTDKFISLTEWWPACTRRDRLQGRANAPRDPLTITQKRTSTKTHGHYASWTSSR